MSNFFIKFLKRGKETKIGWKPPWNDSFHFADTVKEEVRDRRIVIVLRKYLDMEMDADQLSVFIRKDFEVLGELLFDLIFTNENLIIDFENWHLKATANEEEEKTHNIFLEFELEEEFDDLAILPWEYIHYKPQRKELILSEPFLAACSEKKINFYRKIPFKFVASHDDKLSEINLPLKILLIIADPTGKPITKIKELLAYFKNLKAQYPDDAQLEIKYLYQPDASPEGFRSELDFGQKDKSEYYYLEKDLGENIQPHDESFSPDVVHFVGHGYVEDKNGMLFFSEEHPSIGGKFETNPLSDVRFSNGIKNSRLRPKMVFLQVCNGGRVVDYVNKGGIAIRLLEKQIPFVIAMQNPVQENHAMIFTSTFYDNFLRGEDIGTSVSAARFQLAGQGEFSQKAFGSPVLFTFVDTPLKLKSPEPDAPTTSEKPDEKIIKYCNNPGCRYAYIEDKFEAEDKVCSGCIKPLQTKTHGEEASIETRSSRSDSPSLVTQNTDATKTSSKPSGSKNLRGQLNQPTMNGNASRSTLQWSASFTQRKNQYTELIEENCWKAFHQMKLDLKSEQKKLDLEKVMNDFANHQNESLMKNDLNRFVILLLESDLNL